MQVFSIQQNTNSHSLWISSTNWLPPGCDNMFECGLGPGGWVWTNYVQGFSTSGDRDGDGVMDPKYFLHEMTQYVHLSHLGMQIWNHKSCTQNFCLHYDFH